MPFEPKEPKNAPKKRGSNKKKTAKTPVIESGVITIETEKIEQQGAELLAEVNLTEVITSEDYILAADLRKEAKAHIKMVKATMKDSKSKAKAAHTAVCDLEKRLIGSAQEVVKIIDGKMLAWNTEQDRIRQEAQAAAEEAAKVEAEKQRAAEIRDLVNEGADDEAILERTDAPVEVAEVVVEREAPKGTGAAVRKTWKGECTDFTKLVQAVAAGDAPATFLQVNQRVLDDHAREWKGEANIPGYREYQHTIIAGTR